ncbi:MAG: hypothetical protein V3V14_04725 [Saprospiraceae bacterium]
MKIIIHFVFISLLIVLSGCKQQIPLEDQVIAIHDEVMPKMGQIHASIKSIKALKLESNSEIDSKVLDQVILQLEKADDGMMEWMSAWNVPTEKVKKAEYLAKEMIRVTKVKKDILTSIAAADSVLKNHK